MHGGEDQFNRPFGGKPFGFQRVGKTKAAHGQIGAGGAGARQLLVDILAFGNHRPLGQQRQFRCQQIPVQERGTHLDGSHAAFAGQEPGQRNLQLAVGKEEHRFSAKRFACGGDGFCGTGAGCGGDGVEYSLRHAEFIGDGLQPKGGPFGPERKGRDDMACTPADQGGVSIAQKRLHQSKDGVGANRGGICGPAGGQAMHGGDAHRGQQRQCLIFDDIGQGTNQQQGAGVRRGKCRNHRRQTGILALGKGGLDSRTGVIQHPHMRRMCCAHPLSGAVQVQLDDFRRAGADQKQLANVRAA